MAELYKEESYKVLGMTCASCAVSLETYLSPLNGVESVSVNYPNQSVTIKYSQETTAQEQSVKQLVDLAMLAQGLLKGAALDAFIQRNIEHIA